MQTKSNLEYALTYASWGWHVFPVHTIRNGVCSCPKGGACDRPAKHPATAHGLKDATTDEAQIRRWWTDGPDLNIGIATGVDSQIIVLDVDDKDADIPSLPDTICTITGSGGYHHIYRRPTTADRCKTMVRFRPGLDSRADGGYIIAPPSMHASGRRYQWEASSDPFDGLAPQAAPQWFQSDIRVPPASSSQVEWTPSDELPPETEDMLNAIPADDYDTWVRVLMALHHECPGPEGLACAKWWSSKCPEKYDEANLEKRWHGFDGNHANPVTMGSVRELAESHGWVDKNAEAIDRMVKNMLENMRHRKEEAERLLQSNKYEAPQEIPHPKNLLPPPSSLITRMVKYIEGSALYSQPVLSLMAATSFMAALAGRRYESPTGLLSNLYLVGLASSGTGKDHARKCIDTLAVECDLGQFLGSARFASEAGLIREVSAKPSRLYMLDEFGLMLRSMTHGRADSHQAQIVRALLELYSTSGSTYRGVAYADEKKNPCKVIYNPCVTLYGTSTPSTFWAAIKGGQSIDGTLARFVVAHGDDEATRRPIQAVSNRKNVPPDLVRDLKAMVDYKMGEGNLMDLDAADVRPHMLTVPTTEKADAVFENLIELAEEYRGDHAEGTVYSRVTENAIKLALCYAVSIDWRNPQIDQGAAEWGVDLSMWAANTMLQQSRMYLAETDFGAVLNDIKRAIKSIGGTATVGQIIGETPMRPRDVAEALQACILAGHVVETGGEGATKRYSLTKTAQSSRAERVADRVRGLIEEGILNAKSEGLTKTEIRKLEGVPSGIRGKALDKVIGNLKDQGKITEVKRGSGVGRPAIAYVWTEE